MPVINKRKICPKHGFYNAIDNKSCPQCKKQSDKSYDKTLRAQDRKKIYNSKKWAVVREKAMIRDNMMCEECMRNGIITQGKEVDHIIELSDIKNLFDSQGNINTSNKEAMELAFGQSNLQFLCDSCHSKKSYEERLKRNKTQ